MYNLNNLNLSTLTPEQALDIAQNADLDALCDAADRIRK